MDYLFAAWGGFLLPIARVGCVRGPDFVGEAPLRTATGIPLWNYSYR